MSKRILTVTFNPAIDHSVEVRRFRTGEVNRAVSSRKDPGGKGINVATALAQAGISVTAAGFLGRSNDDIFRNHFTDCGIKDEFVYINGRTREGLKINDPSNRSTTDINFNGLQPTQSDLDEFKTRFRKLITSVDYVVLSGSLPPGVPKNIYAELGASAKKAGIFTVLDTSGEPLKAAVDSGSVNLIKPNLEELLELCGEEPEEADFEVNSDFIDGLASRLLNKVDMVALTLGGDGSRLYTAGAVWEAGAPVIALKSTVGAGDSFLAGLTSGFINGLSPGEVLRTAVSWAASKLTKWGPGLSAENPPVKFIDEIKVECRKLPDA